MSSNDIAIEVNNLNKCYTIYDNPRDRLKQFLFPRLQRLLGRSQKQYYREFWALKDISFTIRKGETVGIIGRNGSGKSTLLQILCGTLNPLSGTIQVNGRVAALLELGAGFNPEFTGRENAYMSGQLLGLSTAQIEEKFADIAAFADIGDFMDQPVKTYSSGMYVRLAFAVIAHVDADILVIDEALSVGDAYFVQKCMRFLREFIARGTLLFVSHDTSAVINLCDRAILLNRGKIDLIGTPKDVARHYLAALYEINQSIDGVVATGNIIVEKEPADYKDMRQDMLNASNLRNDIEVFQFQMDSTAFGTGLARVTLVQLTDEYDQPLSWVVGGENVKLKITCTSFAAIEIPIVGFQLMDRLGQTIFGDNTYLTYQLSPKSIAANTTFTAIFEFRMPLLPSGDYSFCVALADGTQENHIQHHWIYEAMIIKVQASSVCFGLMGIPMRRISLESA